MDREYDNTLKEMAWRAYWNGYEQGYGVEEMKKIDRRAAKSKFDRWWAENFE
jgi:hypothetical protein